MAANTLATFSLTIRSEVITLATATLGVRTNGSTGSTSLATTGANGTKITKLWAKSREANAGGASTAGTIFLYYGLTASGAAAAFLFDEITFPSATPTTTVPSARAENLYNDFQLPTGYSIWVSASIKTDLSTAILPNIDVGWSAGDL
mgnify:FL=1